jgi:hypothetical protein
MSKKKKIKKLEKKIRRLQEDVSSYNFRNETALLKAVHVEELLQMYFEQKRCQQNLEFKPVNWEEEYRTLMSRMGTVGNKDENNPI